MNVERGSGRRGALLGIGGLLLALCCVLTPILLGVAIGAALGGLLDIAAAVLIVRRDRNPAHSTSLTSKTGSARAPAPPSRPRMRLT